MLNKEKVCNVFTTASNKQSQKARKAIKPSLLMVVGKYFLLSCLLSLINEILKYGTFSPIQIYFPVNVHLI